MGFVHFGIVCSFFLPFLFHLSIVAAAAAVDAAAAAVGLCYYLFDVYMSTIMMKNDVVEPNEYKNKMKSTCMPVCVSA